MLTIEAGVRLSGLDDFPIYRTDETFGYAPQPNQAGRYLRRNEWVFNDRGLGVARPWRPSDLTDVVVIGNSVILGGNPYDQKDKVAPLMQGMLGHAFAVWPVAAGGWSTVNQIGFLERNPDIASGSDFFVWEYMAHGMTAATPWKGELVFPVSRPLWATGYVLRKMFQERWPSVPPKVPPDTADQARYYARFEAMLYRLGARQKTRPAGLIFLYPDRRQLQGARAGLEWLADRATVERIAAAHRLMLIDVSMQPEWVDALYRDDVHPTREGNVVLAGILSAAVQRGLQRRESGRDPGVTLGR